IYLLVLAFGAGSSIAKRNFARASLIWMVVGIILSVVGFILLAMFGITMFEEISNTYPTQFEEFGQLEEFSQFEDKIFSRASYGLAKCRLAGELLPDDQGVDFVGALIGAYRFQLVGVTQRRVVTGDAVAAQNGAAFASDFDGDSDVIELRHGNLMQIHGAGVIGTTQLQRHELALIQSNGHVGQLLLGQLKSSKWLAELHAR